jgi:hypothetical protein
MMNRLIVTAVITLCAAQAAYAQKQPAVQQPPGGVLQPRLEEQAEELGRRAEIGALKIEIDRLKNQTVPGLLSRIARLEAHNAQLQARVAELSKPPRKRVVDIDDLLRSVPEPLWRGISEPGGTGRLNEALMAALEDRWVVRYGLSYARDERSNDAYLIHFGNKRLNLGRSEVMVKIIARLDPVDELRNQRSVAEMKTTRDRPTQLTGRVGYARFDGRAVMVYVDEPLM